MKPRLLPHLLAALLASPALIAESAPAVEQPTLAELYAAADLVVVAQLLHTDYQYVRGFPQSGKAFLQPLIRYKGDPGTGELLIIEDGEGEQPCLLDDDESADSRLLMFLKIRDEHSFQGVAPYCQLPVFVAANGSYVAAWPLRDVKVPDDHFTPEALQLIDRNANIPADKLRSDELQVLRDIYALEAREDGSWQFSWAVPLSQVRLAMHGEAAGAAKAAEAPAE